MTADRIRRKQTMTNEDIIKDKRTAKDDAVRFIRK